MKRTARVCCNPDPMPHWAIKKDPVLSRLMRACSRPTLQAAHFFVRLGERFMPRNAPQEALYRLPRVVPLDGRRAVIQDNVFIAPNAVVAGDVTVGRKSYIGYNAVVRNEDTEHGLLIGESCSVQEKAVVTGPTTLGKWVTIEPMATVEGADIASCSFVGACAIVMRGAQIESNAMLCASAVLQAGATLPSGEIWGGNPAEKIGELSETEKEQIVAAAKHMVLLGIQHRDTWEHTWEEMDAIREAREEYYAAARDNYEFRVRASYIKDPPKNNKRGVARPTQYELQVGQVPTGGFETPSN